MPEPARILFLINSLDAGGAERQLALTVAALDRSKFEPIVATLFQGGLFLEEVQRAGVQTRDLGRKKTLRNAYTGARRLIRELQPAIVHTSMYEANVGGRVAARRAKLPAVSHATNVYDDPLRFELNPVPEWKLKQARRMERWSARVGRIEVVAVGRAVAESAERYLQVPPERITVVRRGWDFAAMDTASQHRLETAAWPRNAKPKLLTVGRLQPQKGLRYLIQALPRIHERHPRAHLAVAGQGPLMDELTLAAEAVGVRESISFLGVRRDVPSLLRQADLFVFPSLWEGAAGAMVEAMGMGVPVAATDTPPLREIGDIAGSGAAFFPPAGVHDLATAVSDLADDLPAAKAAAEAGIGPIRTAHDIATNTRALEAFYERVLATAAVAERSPDGPAPPA
jgi:glycosyltransferase involved in cell wall biosynthesis